MASTGDQTLTDLDDSLDKMFEAFKRYEASRLVIPYGQEPDTMPDGRPVKWHTADDGSRRYVAGLAAYINILPDSPKITTPLMSIAYMLFNDGHNRHDDAKIDKAIEMADWSRAHSTDPQVRIEATRVLLDAGLSGIGHAEKAIDAAVNGVSDPDPRVRKASLAALVTHVAYTDWSGKEDPVKEQRLDVLREKSFEAVKGASKDPDPEVRMEAVRQLYQHMKQDDLFKGPTRQGVEAMKVLADMEKNDKDPNVQKAAKLARLDGDAEEKLRVLALDGEHILHPGENRAGYYKRIAAQPKSGGP